MPRARLATSSPTAVTPAEGTPSVNSAAVGDIVLYLPAADDQPGRHRNSEGASLPAIIVAITGKTADLQVFMVEGIHWRQGIVLGLSAGTWQKL